jgi:hypothetical protein
MKLLTVAVSPGITGVTGGIGWNDTACGVRPGGGGTGAWFGGDVNGGVGVAVGGNAGGFTIVLALAPTFAGGADCRNGVNRWLDTGIGAICTGTPGGLFAD